MLNSDSGASKSVGRGSGSSDGRGSGSSVGNSDSGASSSVGRDSGSSDGRGSGSSIDMSKSTAVHTVFGFIIGLLLALVGLKFLGSGTNPFITNYSTMALFIVASFTYTIAMMAEITCSGARNCSKKFMSIYIISGSLCCELLGFVLVGPVLLLIMNPSAFLLLSLLCRFDKKFFSEVTETQQITPTTEGSLTTLSDLEAGEVQLPTGEPAAFP